MKSSLHVFIFPFNFYERSEETYLNEGADRLEMGNDRGMSKSHSAGQTNYVSPRV